MSKVCIQNTACGDSHLSSAIVLIQRMLRSKWLSRPLALPRDFRIKRWGLLLLGVAAVPLFLLLPVHWTLQIALIWLWLVSPFVFIPIIPWTLRFRIGPALAPDDLFESGDLEAALERVESAVQSLVLEREN
jgi:hypothetical protein